MALKQASKSNPDVNAMLLHAAGGNDIEKVRSLLDEGADANTSDGFGTTPLLMACMSREAGVEMLQLLLLKGANPNAANSLNSCLTQTMDRINCTLGNRKKLTAFQSKKALKLLEWGADPDHQNYENFNALTMACFQGVPDVVRYLIAAKGEKALNSTADNPLHYAISGGRTDVALMLLDLGANPLISRNNTLPLHAACTKGLVRVVERLVGLGAPLDETDSKGNTALECTTNAEIFQFLLDCGAKPSARTWEMYPPDSESEYSDFSDE